MYVVGLNCALPAKTRRDVDSNGQPATANRGREDVDDDTMCDTYIYIYVLCRKYKYEFA